MVEEDRSGANFQEQLKGPRWDPGSAYPSTDQASEKEAGVHRTVLGLGSPCLHAGKKSVFCPVKIYRVLIRLLRVMALFVCVSVNLKSCNLANSH